MDIKEAHEKGIEAAAEKMIRNLEADEYISASDNVSSIIKAYLSASGMVMVPREPNETMLDSVRHIAQWQHFGSPTELALINHCKALRKAPPKDCREVPHVPPTNLGSYWLYSGIIAAFPNPFQTPEESRENK